MTEIKKEERKARLMILKMRVENFKSYGGVKEIGPFHKLFTSVVGPNGSGKSNVIDAMMFVFGKRSTKLRLSKVSDVIHKSAEYPNLQFASVTVFFQEIIDRDDSGDSDNNYDVVPNSQFTVTRTVDRSDGSAYYISDKKSSFNDVAAKLLAKGIDLDNNRFLILQGEVELISQMKAKGENPGEEGLLEYLEDIIGTECYKKDIFESELIVNQLTKDRDAQRQRLQFAKSAMSSLEGSKKNAEAYLAKSRELLLQKSIILQKENHEFGRVLAVAEPKQAALAAEQAELAASLTEKRAELASAQKERDARLVDLQRAEKEEKTLSEAVQDTERRGTRLEVEHRACVESVERCERQLQQRRADRAKKEKELEQCKVKLPQVRAALVQLTEIEERERQAREDFLVEVRARTADLQAEKAAQLAKNAPADEEEQACRRKESEAAARFQEAEDEVQADAKRAVRLSKQLQEVEAQLAQQAVSHDRTSGDLKVQEQQLLAVAEDQKQAQQAYTTLQERLKDVREKIAELRPQLEAATTVKEESTISKLLQAGKKGGPLERAGIIGRVGELGSLPDKYEIAACNSSIYLNHVVVDTYDGLNKCLEYLRQHNLGRLKFLVFQDIRRKFGELREPPQPPAGAEYLYKLITPVDEALRVLFFQAYRLTMVVQDLSIGRAIAFGNPSQRHRVVTLAGELLETSGALQGGGRVLKGLFGATATSAGSKGAEEAERVRVLFEKLESTARELEAASAQTRARVSELSRDLVQRTDEIAALKKLLERGQKERRRKEDECATLRLQLSESEAAARRRTAGSGSSDEALLASLRASWDSAKRSLQEAQDRAQGGREALRAIEQRIVEVSGDRETASRNRYEKARKDAATTRDAVAKLEALLLHGTAPEEAAEAKEQAKLQEHLERVKQIDQEMDSLANEAMKLQEQLAAAQIRLRDVRADAAALSAAVETGNKELTALSSKEKDVARQLKTVSEEVLKLKKNIEKRQEEWHEIGIQYKEQLEMDVVPGAVAAVANAREYELVQAAADGGAAATAIASNEADHVIDKTVPKDTMPEFYIALSPAVRAQLKSEGHEHLWLTIASPEELSELDHVDLQAKLQACQRDLDQNYKNVNVQDILEYHAKHKAYLTEVKLMDNLNQARERAYDTHRGLVTERHNKFMEGFTIIADKLKEMYQMITKGGDAELELVDKSDPFSEGVTFSVRPPKKSWKNISNLSGGEKTLSSLSLVFALHSFKTAPLYVMDEIDAALDFQNVSIVANYIKEKTKDAQFIIISLRNQMFELADRLVGIYKTKDVTKSVTINPALVELQAKQKVASNTKRDRDGEPIHTQS